EEMAQVTDAEVQTYYDSHKEDFRVSADLDRLLDNLGSPTESNSESDATSSPPNPEPSPTTPSTTEAPETKSAEPDTSCGDDATEPGDTEEGAAEPKATESQAAEPKATEPDATEPEATKAGATDATPSPEVDTQPAEYQPLEKVADQIKNSIALPRVAERVERALVEVNQAMETYYDLHLQWEIQSEKSTNDSEPQQPDITALSAKLGLQYEALPLMDGMTFLEKHRDIAGVMQVVPRGDQGFDQEFLVQRAFSDATQTFRPIRFGNAGMGNEFVFWLASESKEQIQDYSDCRPAVVQAWKMTRAVELARKKGEALAQEARAAEKSLVDQFAGSGKYSVFVPDPDNGISWMSRNNLPINEGGDIFPSAVPDMQFAGWDTMQDIFRLQVGQFGVTVNNPSTIVYVVHMKEEKTNSRELRDRFLGPSVSETTYIMSMRERQLVLQQQLEELEKSMDLKWQVTPQM
ncbi:MAG: hypothetical protein O3C60_20150, partial [Planctomycetota bacterium]|nr:hypothetical protein [Planctomycetota bacterium]